jgi:hypothetical protein
MRKFGFGSIESYQGLREYDEHEPLERPPEQGWRVTTHLILLWCGAISVWAIVGGIDAAKRANQCVHEGVLSTKLCDDATGAGAGVGIAIILLIGFVGFVFLSLIWMMTKPQRRLCPVCGENVEVGLTACGRCKYDFASAFAPSGHR